MRVEIQEPFKIKVNNELGIYRSVDGVTVWFFDPNDNTKGIYLCGGEDNEEEWGDVGSQSQWHPYTDRRVWSPLPRGTKITIEL